MANVPTPHIKAKMGEIAEKILMPGDPLRAKFIAENYLSDAVCVNDTRNMLGFTGNYGKRNGSFIHRNIQLRAVQFL